MRSGAKLVLPVAASAAIVFLAPFAGQLRAALRAAFPGRFATIVAGGVAVAAFLAVLAAVVRIRHDRRRRYALIAAALILAVTYTQALATGRPDVDAVERVHFVEYGLITWLFYRVSRSAADLSVLAVPLFAGLIVGTVEEWYQWFVPNRVGEARDVFLNLAAVGSGLLFSMGLEPPEGLSLRLLPRSRRAVAFSAAAAAFVFALFGIPCTSGSTCHTGTRGRSSRAIRPGVLRSCRATVRNAGRSRRRPFSAGCHAKISSWTRGCGTSGIATRHGRPDGVCQQSRAIFDPDRVEGHVSSDGRRPRCRPPARRLPNRRATRARFLTGGIGSARFSVRVPCWRSWTDHPSCGRERTRPLSSRRTHFRGRRTSHAPGGRRAPRDASRVGRAYSTMLSHCWTAIQSPATTKSIDPIRSIPPLPSAHVVLSAATIASAGNAAK